MPMSIEELSTLDLDSLEGVLSATEIAELRRIRSALSGEMVIPFCPLKPSPAQIKFLRLTSEQALYGGAAGGGKSIALLMAALMYVDRPGYNAVLIRKTFQDLSQPGALMTTARGWLYNTDAKWDSQKHTWTFPSGATLTFGFLESDNDLDRYQGAAYSFIGLDEAGQHSERRYSYLVSRLRRLKDDPIPVRMRVTANPGGPGHDFLKKRFVDPETSQWPYVPATVRENPHLDVVDYVKRLSSLDQLTRDQLLDGKWIHDREGLVYRGFGDQALVQNVPTDQWTATIGIDLGSSERKKTTGFSVVLWSKYTNVAYVAEAWAESGLTPASIAEVCINTMDKWGQDALIVMDEGALGRGYANEMRMRYRLPVIAAKKSDKNGYIKLMNGDLESGRLKVVEHACKELTKEWGTLMWDPSGLQFVRSHDDHISDATLYAWRQSKNWGEQDVLPDTLSESDPEYAKKLNRIEMEAGLARIQTAEATPWWEK